MVMVKVNRIMKSDYEQSPLGIVSTDNCWQNVGPVLASIGPAPSQNTVVEELFAALFYIRIAPGCQFLAIVGPGLLTDTMHSSTAVKRNVFVAVNELQSVSGRNGNSTVNMKTGGFCHVACLRLVLKKWEINYSLSLDAQSQRQTGHLQETLLDCISSGACVSPGFHTTDVVFNLRQNF